MEITLNISRLYELLNYRPGQLLWYLFINGGWIVIVIAILVALFIIRLYFLREKYLKSLKYNLLAIDIPKDNEQSLLAVEQIYAQIHGIKVKTILWEKYWKGIMQLPISLEIVSIEGYIQFLIRTPEKYRDLIEATIYAQYPEAEITEVEDYIKLIPDDIHEIKSEFNLWGTEFRLDKYSAYPIKTYKHFEHGLDQVFIDPMASILEVMSKLGKGEQIGLQIIITPVDEGWKKKGYQIVNKLIGATAEADEHLGDKIVKTSLSWLERFSESIYQLWGNIKNEKEKKEGPPNLILYLTAGEKNIVEAIQNKLSKLSYAITFRIYYLAHSEIYQKGKGLGVNALVGSIKQFSTTDMNSFKLYKRLTTHADYFFIKKRVSRIQKKLIKLYKKRSRLGSTEFYLSTEELATIYHFPTVTVKAPLLKKTEWRKAEPPTTLPTEKPKESAFITPLEEMETIPVEGALSAEQLETPPPDEEDFTIGESLPGYDFSDKSFEEKFTKDKPVQETPISDSSITEPKEDRKTVPDNLPIIE